MEKIVNAINASFNRTIGMSPNDVNIQNAQNIYNRIFRHKIGKREERISNLQVGDLVSLNKWKGANNIKFAGKNNIKFAGYLQNLIKMENIVKNG